MEICILSDFDINNFSDSGVWDYICSGKTKGVFQLESNLGRHWAKQLQPRSILELAALISVIRPGTLMAKIDGKSMTQHYCDRKAGKDPVSYQHESLESILSETYGVLVYQEQSMMIAQKLAGFDLKEADALRKAIGKKKADLMEKVKGQFLEGAEKLGIVSKEIAHEIFNGIEKSNRYAFNKSHAVSYAINAYWSAYCKYYKPTKFYVTYLNHAYRKPDSQREMKELIVDAKGSDIEVYPPRLNYLYKDFTDYDDKIIFGISHVKNVGDKECEKIDYIKNEHNIAQFTWLDCLMEMVYRGKVNKRAAISLMSVGAFNGPKNTTDRKTMLYEFDSWQQLTAREQKYIYDNYKKFNKLCDCIDDMLNSFKLTPKRKQAIVDINQALKNPFYGVKDSVATISQDEESLMGCALTCSKVDDTEEAAYAIMCRDIANGAITGKANIVVSISSVRQYKTKKGKNPGQLMAFVCAEDSSGMLDSITVFPETFEEYKDLLVEGNTVLINGEISKRDKTSIIVNKVRQV